MWTGCLCQLNQALCLLQKVKKKKNGYGKKSKTKSTG